MFSRDELAAVTSASHFVSDFNTVRQSLVNSRLHQATFLFSGSEKRLMHFSEAVLASAVEWSRLERLELCRVAAEISEALAAHIEEPNWARTFRLRSAMLYELAELPALAGSVLSGGDVTSYLLTFFKRKGVFSHLNGVKAPERFIAAEDQSLGELAMIDDAMRFEAAAQGFGNGSVTLAIDGPSVAEIASHLGNVVPLGLTASEMRGFSVLVRERTRRSTRLSVEDNLLPALRSMEFPLELLPAQHAAIQGGLLDSHLPAWGFAAPTGSGKTYLSRLLIADLLAEAPDAKVIYLVPSKALVSEVSTSLTEAFEILGHRTLALSAQLVDLDAGEQAELEDAAIVVMTPEKADLLLRLGAALLESVRLAIVDEAHHIESGTRGALLELYLWRLKRLLPSNCRYVFLSAVAPNIEAIAKWMDPRGTAVRYDRRATRMRIGIYSLQGKGSKTRGVIKYSDGTSIEVIPHGAETSMRRALCEVAEFLHSAGPVLVVAKGKRECEKIADELAKWLEKKGRLSRITSDEAASDTHQKLDTFLDREMYSEVALRQLIKSRIAYHHAGLPPNVRRAVEEAIRRRQIDYVIATTTLAEGVNFPFSSVVVQSLALREPPEAGRPSKYAPITPRTFWNIAGRAGRPGFDSEGQVILFEPSLGLDKIGAVVESYITPDLSALSPVKSALASALMEIQAELASENYDAAQLENVKLPEKMSRQAKGAINLLRVGLMHAYATKLIISPEEIVESSFAVGFLTGESRQFALNVIGAQDKVIKKYVAEDDGAMVRKIAELGLSLETLGELRTFVEHMDDWQLKNCSKLFYGGSLNLNQAPFVVGPVAKRMSELEGPALGGFLSEVIVQWLSGVTFTSIRAQSKFTERLEDLIAVIYSRVQFLLPWGLWAADWLVEEEARKRGINYENEIRKLAYLADAGVPSFDALHLHHLGIERVDATRLSTAYHRAGGTNTGIDCVGWIISQPVERLERILNGLDGRRPEFGFRQRIETLRSAQSRNQIT